MAKRVQPDRISTTIDANTKPIQEKIHALSKDIKELTKQNQECRREITRLAATEGDHSAEIKRLNEVIDQNTRTIEANRREIDRQEASLSLSGKTASQLRRHLKDLQRELSNTSRAADPKRYRELEDQIGQTRRALTEATRSSRGFLESLLSMEGATAAVKGFFMGLVAIITGAVLGAFGKLKETIQGFAAANSQLAGILGTSREGIERLTEQAKELGRTTSATASEVTGLQIELAKLGFTMGEIEAMTPAVLKFAKTVGADLSSASAFAGAALRIFGKDASQMEDVLATLAVATTKSALDFGKLEASMATIGPVAAAFGLSLEDTTALLGVLANAGFDASSAATATRNILLNLCDASGELATALGGPARNLDGIVSGLKKLNAEGVDLARVLEITDKRSVAAFSSFLAQSDSLITLRDSISGVNGEFQQMAATMADNSAAAEQGFYSALEGLVLQFGGLDNILKFVYNSLTALTQGVGAVISWFEPFVRLARDAGTAVAALVKAVGSIFNPLARWSKESKTVATVLATIKGIIPGIIVSLGTYITLTKVSFTAIKAKAAALWAEVKATFAAKTAQDGLNASMKANPILLVISLIAGFVVALGSLKRALGEVKDAEDDLAAIRRKGREGIVEQQTAIETLLAVARDETAELGARHAAINELNRIIPEYNAQLDETTGKYIENKKALDDYLDSLAHSYEVEGAKDILKDIGKKKAELREQRAELEDKKTKAEANAKVWPAANAYSGAIGYNTYHYEGEADQAAADIKDIDKQLEKLDQRSARIRKDYGADIAKAAGVAVEGVEDVNNGLDETEKKTNRIKEINQEIAKLRKQMKTADDEEQKRLQARIDTLNKEKRGLLGKPTATKRTPGTYQEDSLAEATAEAEKSHKERLAQIEALKGEVSETELAIKKNQELIRYCEETIDALEGLRDQTDATHTQTLDKIAAKIGDMNVKAVNAQTEINKAIAQQEQQAYEKRTAAAEAFYNGLQLRLEQSVADEQMTRQQADLLLLSERRAVNQKQLDELAKYREQVKTAEYLGAEDRAQALEKLAAKEAQLRRQALTDAASFAETMRALMTDTTSRAGITDAYRLQVQELQALYATAIEIVGEGTEEAYLLEAERERKVAALNYEHQERLYQLQELTGLSWADEYDRELAKLDNYHAQGLVSEENYQKARLKLQATNAKKYFDYYSGLSGSMFGAIQEAEIAASEAKYDVLIQQAKNAGEDTTALEQEKENKKLEIQKKYADVDFAVKVSEIVANTAVAIMQAFAQLGPIGGAVAAAMLTATGAAQAAIANAEREKVKNMQPGVVSPPKQAEGPATAQRVLSGYSDGGYTGDGGRYEVAGVVHRGEYVVPMPIMADPRVIDAVGTIEAIRRDRIRGSATVTAGAPAGFADGGHTSQEPAPAYGAELVEAARELRAALADIHATVSLQSFDEARARQQRSRAPFTRNKKL